jgi:hypothetical protein
MAAFDDERPPAPAAVAPADQLSLAL